MLRWPEPMGTQVTCINAAVRDGALRCLSVAAALALSATLVACGEPRGPGTLPPFLCVTCQGDGDCGGNGNRCLDLADGTTACGTDCAAHACPAGFSCAAVAGGGRNCIPASGTCPLVSACAGGCAPGERCNEATRSCEAVTDAGAPDSARPHLLPWPTRDGEELDLGDLGALRFVATGDVRPAEANDPYPFATLQRTMQLMDQAQPRFGIFLGDYIYVYPDDYALATQQFGYFLDARAAFAPELYYLIGNHEASGANLEAYRALMCSSHYYALRGRTTKGSLKIVVLADNRWEANYQKPWAESMLAQATDYTIVAHHYPHTSPEEPTDGDLPAVLARHHVTLELAGHHHLYDRDGALITVGIAGGPLAPGQAYTGFVLVELQGDGRLKGTAVRADTGNAADVFYLAP
jgi:hypothetical protein